VSNRTERSRAGRATPSRAPRLPDRPVRARAKWPDGSGPTRPRRTRAASAASSSTGASADSTRTFADERPPSAASAASIRRRPCRPRIEARSRTRAKAAPEQVADAVEVVRAVQISSGELARPLEPARQRHGLRGHRTTGRPKELGRRRHASPRLLPAAEHETRSAPASRAAASHSGSPSTAVAARRSTQLLARDSSPSRRARPCARARHSSGRRRASGGRSVASRRPRAPASTTAASTAASATPQAPPPSVPRTASRGPPPRRTDAADRALEGRPRRRPRGSARSKRARVGSGTRPHVQALAGEQRLDHPRRRRLAVRAATCTLVRALRSPSRRSSSRMRSSRTPAARARATRSATTECCKLRLVLGELLPLGPRPRRAARFATNRWFASMPFERPISFRTRSISRRRRPGRRSQAARRLGRSASTRPRRSP